jgi:hypothetical protein
MLIVHDLYVLQLTVYNATKKSTVGELPINWTALAYLLVVSCILIIGLARPRWLEK